MRIRPFLYPILALLLLMAASFASGQAEAPATNLTGSVATENQRPLSGAQIIVTDGGGTDHATVTDAEGHYSLDGLAAGPARVRFSSPCCTTQIHDLSLTAGQAQQFDATLRPQTRKPSASGFLLWGRTYDAFTQQPQPWVRVSAYSPSEDYETASRADGMYFLEVPAGDLGALASRIDLRETRFDLTLSNDQRLDIPVLPGRTWVNLRALPGGSGTAIWTGPCTEDVCRAQPDQSEDGRFTYEEASGGVSGGGTRFHAPQAGTSAGVRVPPGVYEFTGGSGHGLQKLEILPGQTWELEAHPLEAGDDRVAVTGTVRDADTDGPLQGIWVDVRNEPRGQSSPQLVTDANGEFSTLVSPGAVTIRVQPYDNATLARYGRTYYPTHQTVQLTGARDFDVSVPRTKGWPSGPSVRITGWIVDSSSNAGVAAATIHLRNEVTYEWGQATSDGDGSYGFDVQPGRYTLAAFTPDRPWGLTTFDATAEITWQNLTLVDPRCCGSSDGGAWYGRLVTPQYYVPGATAASTTAAPVSTASPTASSASPAMRPLPAAGHETSDGAPIMFEGAAVYAGSAGELGPYKAQGSTSSGQTKPILSVNENDIPGPNASLVVLAVFALLVTSGRMGNRRN